MVVLNTDDKLPCSSFAEYFSGNADVLHAQPLQEPVNANEGRPSSNRSAKELDLALLDDIRDELEGDITCRLGSLTISKLPLEDALENKQLFIEHPPLFSNRIALEPSINNQSKSYLCWNYAGLNMMRFKLMEQYNLAEFDFSKAYLFFYDKVEKANWFLENVLSTLDQSLDSRLVQCIFAKPVNDPAQWSMFVPLIEKYGMVPYSAYPDTYHNLDPAHLVTLLSSVVREFALHLRNEYANGKSVEELRTKKAGMIKEVYRIMTITNMSPPKKFTWAFYDRDGTFHEFKDITPLKFYKDYMRFDCLQTVSLYNDPRNEYMRKLKVGYTGSVVGGQKIDQLNVPMSEIKRLAAKLVMAGHPLWFASDVSKLVSLNGIADTNIFDYKTAFNAKYNLTKAERMQCLESHPTHVMVLTGVHIEDSKIVRWQAENSFGKEFGNNGYLTITDKWFDEYVYQMVVMKSELSQEMLDALENDTIVLPPWDITSIWYV
ncbi:bleomycin hydrolase [Coemansia guatemalensis]|uniref:Cysteine proteinase 1, mitochondrial n=1 Tax=Coemansia guatemalensis TaxID=2761395 RepID=A0A9W8LUG8_9FUNG|nr:bleomycin hydrolase [Coemansia guatemalensis]